MTSGMSPTILVGIRIGPRHTCVQQDSYAAVRVVYSIPKDDWPKANHRSPKSLWLWSLCVYPHRSTKEQVITKIRIDDVLGVCPGWKWLALYERAK